MGALREHLGGPRCFGSHHHPFAIGDHALHRGDGIEGWQRAAGQRLPHAALDHPRPHAQHGVQLLPYDGVLPPELTRQGPTRTPLQLAAARAELVVHTLRVRKHALQALT